MFFIKANEHVVGLSVCKCKEIAAAKQNQKILKLSRVFFKNKAKPTLLFLIMMCLVIMILNLRRPGIEENNKYFNKLVLASYAIYFYMFIIWINNLIVWWPSFMLSINGHDSIEIFFLMDSILVLFLLFSFIIKMFRYENTAMLQIYINVIMQFMIIQNVFLYHVLSGRCMIFIIIFGFFLTVLLGILSLTMYRNINKQYRHMIYILEDYVFYESLLYR